MVGLPAIEAGGEEDAVTVRMSCVTFQGVVPLAVELG
jgi:hypothetical protein